MQRHAAILLAALSLSAWAGGYDYWECTAADGHISHTVDRCPRGESARRIEDNIRPVSFKLGEAGDSLIRLASGNGGHFYSSASINGVGVRVLVDTGATLVAVSPAAAARTGLDRKPYRPGITETANGRAAVRFTVADSIELGGTVIRDVPVTILSRNLGGEDVLLGMSFLRHFNVNMADGVMTLQRK